VSTPEEVLPANLWLNSWRPDHKLVDANLDLDEGIVLLTYKYAPSIYYGLQGGKATHFEFTVGTAIEPNEFINIWLENNSIIPAQIAYNFEKLDEVVQELYAKIFNARDDNLLNFDNFIELLSEVMKEVKCCKADLITEKLKVDDIPSRFAPSIKELAFRLSPAGQILQDNFDILKTCLSKKHS
jgi:hypothetical protein